MGPALVGPDFLTLDGHCSVSTRPSETILRPGRADAMHGTFANLVASYGYAFLVLIVGIESFGIPLPGETALVTAAALAALGRLNIYGVIAAAAAGAIIGDNAGYW